jgi:hypothetical protein
MADISNVVKNLLGGADAKTIRSVASVVVDAMSRLEGETYQLVPASDEVTRPIKLSGFAKSGTPTVKKIRRWGRLLEGVDYTKKANGYALVGGWASCFDLSKHDDGALALINVPHWGMIMGKVACDQTTSIEYDNGKTGEIKHFRTISSKMENGDYASVIAKCKELGLPQMTNPDAKEMR